jgi:hypothetical protein
LGRCVIASLLYHVVAAFSLLLTDLFLTPFSYSKER